MPLDEINVAICQLDETNVDIWQLDETYVTLCQLYEANIEKLLAYTMFLQIIILLKYDILLQLCLRVCESYGVKCNAHTN